MFQGIRELRSAKGRTALITITVGMITIMVTFLSSLAAGLSFESVSALQARFNSDATQSNQALLLQDSGTSSLASSRLTPNQLQAVEAAGGEALYMSRAKVGTSTVVLLSDAQIKPGTVEVPEALYNDAQAAMPEKSVVTVSDEVYLDHQPVLSVNPRDLKDDPSASTAALVSEDFAAPSGTVMLKGKERWNASASYQGEQTSLNMMVVLLYVISALVLGAFFTVWTMQRLRGVAISSALGASRRVLIGDSLGQALVILAGGIVAGVLITFIAGSALASAMPITLNATTLAQPTVILAAAGLLGATISIRPVLKVSPRTALAAG